MARRRKQTNDPRQLSLFDVMANQIEEIRAENIQDDMREEAVPEVVPPATEEQTVPSEPEQHQEFSFPTNDRPERTLLGINGNGESVYEMRDGSRMYSRDPAIMQIMDGDKRTPEKLFEAGADEYLTVQEIHHFTHTLPWEAQHARQTNLSAGNRKKGSQARNHQRRAQRGLHAPGLLDFGSLGAEQPRRLKKLEAMGKISFDLKVFGQQQTEARALSSETARQASLRGMSDSEILQSMGIDMSLRITE